MSNQDSLAFDTRVVKHHLRRGALTDEQLQQWLDSLPDDAAEGEQTETMFVNTYETRLADDSGA